MLSPSLKADETGALVPTPLEHVIHERIINRLGRRVRNLAVSIEKGVIRLSGSCSTYYTKQLVQNAVLGVIEDERIDNDLVVSPMQPDADG